MREDLDVTLLMRRWKADNRHVLKRAYSGLMTINRHRLRVEGATEKSNMLSRANDERARMASHYVGCNRIWP